MKELTKSVFTGNWKSFKIFKGGGEIKLDNTNSFQEFDFTRENLLTISQYRKTGSERIARTQDWTVELKGSRHYLCIAQPKTTYEIVTINHTVMVLAEEGSSSKIFFAAAHLWQDRLQSNKMVII